MDVASEVSDGEGGSVAGSMGVNDAMVVVFEDRKECTRQERV